MKLGSAGPALYRQTRVGRYGERFQLVKFRTMVNEADRLADGLMEHSTDPDWLVLDEDPRVTRVGRLLRPRRELSGSRAASPSRRFSV